MPSTSVERKKCLSAMWAIWYSHELYPYHQKTLNNSLKFLLKYSESRITKDNPLRYLVKFTSSKTLTEVSRIWKMWLGRKIESDSINKMHLARRTEMMQRGWLQGLDRHVSTYSYSCVHVGDDFENIQQ